MDTPLLARTTTPIDLGFVTTAAFPGDVGLLHLLVSVSYHPVFFFTFRLYLHSD